MEKLGRFTIGDGKEEIGIHISIAVISLFFLAASRAWKLFSDYHSTILFMISGNLLHLFFSNHYMVWYFVPDTASYPAHTELIYTFVIFPATVLLFFHGFPKSGVWWKQVIYLGWWVVIYSACEWLLSETGRIVYDHSWSWTWSTLFDCMMFPMLLLHHRNPVLAYALSVIIVVALVYGFHVPMGSVL